MINSLPEKYIDRITTGTSISVSGKLIKSFIKSIFYFLTLQENKKNKYLYRFLGLLNSMIGKPAFYRGKKSI